MLAKAVAHHTTGTTQGQATESELLFMVSDIYVILDVCVTTFLLFDN